MLIKAKDKELSTIAIGELEAMLALPALPGQTRARIEREIKMIRSGERGEKESAYFIDFHYKDNPNYMVIHDLRLEHGGQVAQIDHLLINRFLDIYVLESKHYAAALKITEQGEFLISYDDRQVAIESPIEQNKRHAVVLERVIHEQGLVPKRLGVKLEPTFKPYVLVSPQSVVTRPPQERFDTSMVIKSDQLFTQIRSQYDSMSNVSFLGKAVKMVSSETMVGLAEQLVSQHKPIVADLYAKFGIPRPEPRLPWEIQPPEPAPPAAPASPPVPAEQQVAASEENYFCYRCRKSITRREAIYCFQNKGRFGGKAYCYACQRAI